MIKLSWPYIIIMMSIKEFQDGCHDNHLEILQTIFHRKPYAGLNRNFMEGMYVYSVLLKSLHSDSQGGNTLEILQMISYVLLNSDDSEIAT